MASDSSFGQVVSLSSKTLVHSVPTPGKGGAAVLRDVLAGAPFDAGVTGFVVAALVMRRTSFGLRVYATGGNRTAAEVAGVDTRRVLTSVYVISGALAGLSGIVLSSRVISGPPNLGAGYELDAIAAVVIGGASLLGGRGTVWGTLLGLLLIQTLNNGLDILVVPAYWQAVISGVLIVAAVAVDVWATRRQAS